MPAWRRAQPGRFPRAPSRDDRLNLHDLDTAVQHLCSCPAASPRHVLSALAQYRWRAHRPARDARPLEVGPLTWPEWQRRARAIGPRKARRHPMSDEPTVYLGRPRRLSPRRTGRSLMSGSSHSVRSRARDCDSGCSGPRWRLARVAKPRWHMAAPITAAMPAGPAGPAGGKPEGHRAARAGKVPHVREPPRPG
jgi:hypothetical protein